MPLDLRSEYRTGIVTLKPKERVEEEEARSRCRRRLAPSETLVTVKSDESSPRLEARVLLKRDLRRVVVVLLRLAMVEPRERETVELKEIWPTRMPGVGAWLGAREGLRVGACEGARVGRPVGSSLGVAVGVTEGWSDGIWEGRWVGALVGVVGSWVGTRVGEVLGSWEGAIEGAAVGA